MSEPQDEAHNPGETPLPPSAGTTEAPAEVLHYKPGDQIGRYKLLRELGHGGFGVVYLAEQESPIRRQVALKVIKLGMDTQAVISRFEAERQALTMMNHPNIAKVLDAGATDSGRPYFVMELVQDGMPITAYCDHHRFSIRQRLALFALVCQAIQHAHQKGIIHRDIKPSNILVTLLDGVPVPKVIDFGISKATQQPLTETAAGQFLGTRAYMSPEQAKSSALALDTRSDIYGLGVLLYELLTGRTPFDSKLDGKTDEEKRRIICDAEPLRPSTRFKTLDAVEQTAVAERRHSEAPFLFGQIRGDMDWIVTKCLEKDPTRRYATVNGLAMDLQRHLTDEPVEAAEPSPIYKIQKYARRNKVALTIVAVLVFATGFSAWQAFRATRATVLAKERLTESEAIAKFLTGVFQSPDPARDGRTITVAETLDKATKKLESDLADQPARRALLQSTLAHTYFALGLPRTAIPLEEKVRDYYRATLGPEHPETLKTMNNLTSSYASAGRRDEATKLQEEVLLLDRKVLGSEHPQTLTTMNNLAYSYANAGRRDEALKLQEEVLTLRRKVSGPEHPDTLPVMNNLAVYYDNAGRLNEALKLREQVLTLSRKVKGPEHPETLSAMEGLANSYADAGRWDEAIKVQEEVLMLRRKALGPQHPDTLSVMDSLANSYGNAGRRDEALKLHEEVLSLDRKVLGPEHPQTLNVMNNLAYSYADAGRRDEAIKLQEEVLTLRRKVLGPEHHDTLWTMINLAGSYRGAGRADEAIKLGQSSLEIYRRVSGPTNANTLNAMTELAISYQIARHLGEAIALEEESLRLKRRHLPPGDPDTVESIENLATCYEQTNRKPEAEALRRELAELKAKAGKK